MAGKPRKTYLSITGWDGLQPKHGDRTFPWIRNYSARIEDPEWRKLTKAQRSDLNDLELLANRVQNRIQDDADYLTRYFRLESPIELETLINAGFVCRQKVGKQPARSRQDGDAGKVRSGEVRLEEEKVRSGESSGDASSATNLSPSAFDQPNRDHAEYDFNSGSAVDVIEILTSDAGKVRIDSSTIKTLSQQFPGIDVPAEIRKLAFKVMTNPGQRPIARALKSSLEGWLRNARPPEKAKPWY